MYTCNMPSIHVYVCSIVIPCWGDIVLALSFVRSLSVRPSILLSCFSVWTHILVMDFQIILSFYRNMNLHTKFGCTAPTGNRVMALCYFKTYIVDSETFCQDAYLGNGFSDFITPCRKYRGGISFWCCLSVLPLSVCPAGYGLRKVDQRLIVKSLASYH